MKKISIILTALALSSSVAIADEFTTNVSKLPETARNFISANFPQAKVLGIKIDRGFIFIDDYEVTLSDNTQLSFTSSGEIKEIENKMSGIPTKLIPTNIADYLTKNYASAKVQKFDRGDKNIEIKLVNGVELKFSLDGNFLGLD